MSVSAPQAGPSNAAGRNATPTVPFAQASMHAFDNPLEWTYTPGVGTTNIGPSDLTPNGFLRWVDIHVQTVTPGQGGAVNAGFPFNLIDNVQFIDAGGQRMDDLSGYALFVDNVLGGSPYISDPRLDYTFSASPTSPDFRLRIAREMFPNGAGSLPNLSGNQKYRLRMVMAALSEAYDQAPAAAPELSITIVTGFWFLPDDEDAGGRTQEQQPPLLGLAQYRTAFYPAWADTNTARISEQMKSTGSLIKYIAMMGWNSAGQPSDAVFPDPITFKVDNNYPYSDVPLNSAIREAQNMLPENAGRITGLVPILYNYGGGRIAGANGVGSLLATTTATFLNLQGSQAVATDGTIDLLICEISTAQVDPAKRSQMNPGTGTWQPAIPATVSDGV